MNDIGENDNERSKDDRHVESRCNCTEETKKTIFGIVIVCCLSVSWVGAAQFSQSSVTSTTDFYAPYFVTWFNTCWMTLCFPLYIIVTFFIPKLWTKSEDSETIKDIVGSSLVIFGDRRTDVYLFFTRIYPMNTLWLGVNCTYIYALSFIAATDASAVLSTNVAFVYIFSLIIFHGFFILRLLATGFCVAGVVLFSYSSGFTGGSFVGILLALLSALGSAIYQVIFKRLVGNATLGKVSMYLSLLGVCNLLCFWFIALVLHLTNVSPLHFNDMPWNFLLGAAVLSLSFNFLVNFGIAFTYPLFISIAMMLGVPLNAVVDKIFKGVEFSGTRIFAAALILLGFSLMLIPDDYNYPIHRVLGCKSCTPTPNVLLHVNEDEETTPAINKEEDAVDV